MKPVNFSSMLSALLFASALAAPIKDNTIQGKITDWPAGKTGEIRLVPRVNMFGAGAVVATAAVDEKGQFNLSLPDAAVLEKVLPASAEKWNVVTACHAWDGVKWCTNELALAPAARLNLFDLQAFVSSEQLRNVKLASAPYADPAAGLTRTYLAFAPAAVKVTGTFTSSNKGNALSADWNADLSAGWSWLTETYGVQDAATGVWPVKVTAGDLPTSLNYTLSLLRTKLDFEFRRVQSGSRVGGLITAIMPGGAAERAGFKVDDIIVALDGRDVSRNSSSLLLENLSRPPGTTVQVTVKRGDQTLTLPLTGVGAPVNEEH